MVSFEIKSICSCPWKVYVLTSMYITLCGEIHLMTHCKDHVIQCIVNFEFLLTHFVTDQST